MHQKLRQILTKISPEWLDVREGIELLFNDPNRPPNCDFEHLCNAVTVWGASIDSVQVTMFLGGNQKPRMVVRKQITNWLKEQLEVYRNREQSTDASAVRSRVDISCQPVAENNADD